MDHHETGRVLDDLISSGKIKAAGVSNFRPHDWHLLQSAMDNALLTNQIELSLGHVAPFTNGDVAFHHQSNHPIMAWSPLGGGALMGDTGALGVRLDDIAGQYGVDRAAVAIAFLLHHPAQIMPILGTNNLGRIAAISSAMKVKLDRETWFGLYEAALGHEVP